MKFIPVAFIFLILFSCNSKKDSYDVLILGGTILNVQSQSKTADVLIGITNDTIKLVGNLNDKDLYVADQIVDAKGKFLIPSLWDNHVHFRGGKDLIEENKNLLPLFLSYGVTTVRDAGGDITTSIFEWRNAIETGSLSGPYIFTSGPKLDGAKPAWDGSIKVASEEDVLAALDLLESIDADYVKMYDGSLSAESFYSIIKEAEKRNLKTTGHMPLTANLMTAISHGLDGSEHLYYPLKACSPLSDSLGNLGLGYGIMNILVNSYDTTLASEVFEKMGENNFFVTPTLYIGDVLREILDVDHSQDTLRKHIGSGIQATYQRRIESAKRARASNFRENLEKVFKGMIVPMHRSNVNILAGSDCGAFNSFIYPGESLHGELQRLVDTGLTPAEALQTSIINGPKFFNLEAVYGSIEVNKVADILILNENPLTDIQNLTKIHTLINKGVPHSKSDLSKMLNEIK